MTEKKRFSRKPWLTLKNDFSVHDLAELFENVKITNRINSIPNPPPRPQVRPMFLYYNNEY